MALRNIRFEGDEVLRKKSKEVDEINERIISLIDDMVETMYNADGVGLSAPQVGILKRIAVIDTGERLIELINPVIIEETGEQYEIEGCLSVPGVAGVVKRPENITVEALNKKGEKEVFKGTDLLARAFSHEIDHLDGILFVDKAIRFVEVEKQEGM